ncbi:hypothetical protein DN745_17505 [Bradymonas sediminis]|uniref:Uncharacterized protein n=1 Tax=Bradymonas sediminis TaxID=1548548 RepID=A0A2Z4FPS8_9DELT|nr:hypothetical protein DN745_17505 [Bradymonas sediminis]
MSNSKADRDNRSNQLNPNNDAYWSSRGQDAPGAQPSYSPSQDDRDNRSRQLDPEHPTYDKSRGK